MINLIKLQLTEIAQERSSKFCVFLVLVVIKVKVKNCSTARTKSMYAKLLHQTIEDLRNRNKPRSAEADKLISQLREEGVEILNSQLDRQTVVVWIWCRSQAALEYIQELYESN